MLCALIMAGGKGERFWPVSTDEKPKQFLKLVGNNTMIQMTVSRMKRLMPIENIFIVTGERYVSHVKEQIYDIPDRNIIVEPEGRNTAPCIALSAFYIEKIYGDAALVVVPSDHLILNEDKYTATLNAAQKFIEDKSSAVVTLGIKPDRPETGYGYIKADSFEENINGFEINKIEGFKEKPDKETAEKYIECGNYYWNSGMFMWKTSTIKSLVKKYLNRTYQTIDNIMNSYGTDSYNEILKRQYKFTESISIDYGIMEKAENIYVIPSCFGWDDVGSWFSLERYMSRDSDNNVFVGNIKKIDCKNNIVYCGGKKIAIAGIDDVFVIESSDIILIGRKEYLNNIKQLKAQINN